MNNIVGLLLLILFGGAGLISTFLIVYLLLPSPVERTRQILETNLLRSLLLGLVNSLFASLLVALFIWLAQKFGGPVAAIPIFLAGLTGMTIIVLTILGLVAVTSLLGSRIGDTKSPTASHLRGGLLLLLACLTPYFGWFIFTPLAVWTALGAAIQTIFRRKEKTA